MNPTIISALAGTALAAVSLFFTVRQAYLHRNDETKKEREGREEREAEATTQREQSRSDRLDKQTWEYVEGLRVEMTRLAARVETLETRLQAEQTVTAELRADLAQANATIRTLTAENQRQGQRIAELEHKRGG